MNKITELSTISDRLDYLEYLVCEYQQQKKRYMTREEYFKAKWDKTVKEELTKVEKSHGWNISVL